MKADDVYFQDPWLVQRISRPRPSQRAEGSFNPVGLSEDVNLALGAVLSFELMGSMEFESGAVPKCLQAMAKMGQHLKAIQAMCQVPAPSLSSKEEEAAELLGWNQPMPEREVLIWMLAHERVLPDMLSWVQTKLAREQRVPELKKYCGFMSSAYLNTWLAGRACEELEFNCRTVAWLDLRNKAFWTIDEAMFLKVCELFGVMPPK